MFGDPEGGDYSYVPGDERDERAFSLGYQSALRQIGDEIEQLRGQIEVTSAMREAGAMKLLEVRSCMCETEEDAAEAIFMAMIRAMSG